MIIEALEESQKKLKKKAYNGSGGKRCTRVISILRERKMGR